MKLSHSVVPTLSVVIATELHYPFAAGLLATDVQWPALSEPALLLLFGISLLVWAHGSKPRRPTPTTLTPTPRRHAVTNRTLRAD